MKDMTEKKEEKHFAEWVRLKENLHNTGRMPAIKEGEVWWCALGENIGVEINGKNEVFSRPVLILNKLSRYGFMGIPLTSQPHNGSWYASFVFRDETSYAALAQARVISTSRLYERMGTLPDSDLQAVQMKFAVLYLEHIMRQFLSSDAVPRLQESIKTILEENERSRRKAPKKHF